MSKIRVATILLAALAIAIAQSSTLQLLSLWGAGSGTSTGTGGNLEGTAQTNLVGTVTFSLTFTNGKLLGQNGSGTGTCSLEDGQVVLTASQGTITLSQVGMSCNISAGAAPNTLNATYLVTAATGKFQGITGTGGMVVGFSSSTGPASGLIRLDGVLK